MFVRSYSFTQSRVLLSSRADSVILKESRRRLSLAAWLRDGELSVKRALFVVL